MSEPYVVAGLKIKLLDESTLPGVVNQSSVEYEEVGLGKITLVVDGEAAKELLAVEAENDSE